MTTHIDVDFNGVEPDGRLTALVDHADGLVEAGALVILRDADGNRCEARVLSVIGRLITLDVDWSTWNRVNTLLDALAAVTEELAPDATWLDRVLEPPLTGFDPEDVPDRIKDPVT